MMLGKALVMRGMAIPACLVVGVVEFLALLRAALRRRLGSTRHAIFFWR